MVSLIFILVSLTLLVGFFMLSAYETRRGVRLFARERARLDGDVTRITFVLTHVDFGAFVRDLVIHATHCIVHDVVHFSLLAVRAVERFLTRIVRMLRTWRAADIVPHENTREFVKTLSDFKGHLKETRPDVPDILN